MIKCAEVIIDNIVGETKMSARATSIGGHGSSSSSNLRGRRRASLIWVAVTVAVVIALLYWEQIALLYVLATLGVTVLLVVVALADLDGSRRPATEPRVADDSAAIGSSIASAISPTIPDPNVSSSTARAARARRPRR